MSFKPMADRILIQRDDPVEVSDGGLYLPPESQETPYQGTVIAVGNKVEEVKESDRILFGKYAGSEIEVGGEQFIILEEESVLGVMDAD